MSRDDSVLYTGMNSASFARVKEKKAEVKEKKNDEKSILEKNGAVILTRLDEEIASIPKQIFDLVDINDSAETYKTTLIALKKYESKLTSLRAEFLNILGLKGGKDV